jgi:hypothetical protein
MGFCHGERIAMSNTKPSIFLSYARNDDEPFVKRLYEDLIRRGFDVWWNRKSMPSRNLTFHQEIRDAVAACDRLVLVVGPKAIVSDYVRQEWQFAWYQAEKVVTPILRLGDYLTRKSSLTLWFTGGRRLTGRFGKVPITNRFRTLVSRSHHCTSWLANF